MSVHKKQRRSRGSSVRKGMAAARPHRGSSRHRKRDGSSSGLLWLVVAGLCILVGYGIVSEEVIPQLPEPENTEEPKSSRPLKFQASDLGSAPIRFDLVQPRPTQRFSSDWGLAFSQDSSQAEFKQLRQTDPGSAFPGFKLEESPSADLESQRLARSGFDSGQGFQLSAELRGHFDPRDRGSANRIADALPGGGSDKGRRGGPGGQDGGRASDPTSPDGGCVGSGCVNGETQDNEGGRGGRDTLPPDRLRDSPVTVPEPSTLVLLGAAMIGLGLLVWFGRRG